MFAAGSRVLEPALLVQDKSDPHGPAQVMQLMGNAHHNLSGF